MASEHPDREFDALSTVRYTSIAGWSSLVARRAHNPKVVSSNLTPATIQFVNSQGLAYQWQALLLSTWADRSCLLRNLPLPMSNVIFCHSCWRRSPRHGKERCLRLRICCQGSNLKDQIYISKDGRRVKVRH